MLQLPYINFSLKAYLNNIYNKAYSTNLSQLAYSVSQEILRDCGKSKRINQYLQKL